jgi:indole-3-glycerol phosphate synthase
MGTYLDGIMSWQRARAAGDVRAVIDLAESARSASRADPPRPFEKALRPSAGVAVVAEFKRRSPSAGPISEGSDPSSVAVEYERGGAACVSVLTDAPHFGGSAEDLQAARHATSIPVLRKDFTVCLADVYDSRIMGADAILLIASVLTDDELRAFLEESQALAMAAIVEVHDEAELERALACGATIVGVNQRDLRTFEVDSERAERLAALIPGDIVRIAESGIATARDVSRLVAAGYDAVLVGESLMRHTDRASAVEELRSAGGA